MSSKERILPAPTMDVLLDGVRAGGGYKYRERFPRVSNQDLPAFIAGCEAAIRDMALQLQVAEGMLNEPAPSIHARWEEYQRRVRREMAVRDVQHTMEAV